MENKEVVKIAIFTIVGFCFGYLIGCATVIAIVAEIADHFIELDYDTIAAALYQYRNHINLIN